MKILKYISFSIIVFLSCFSFVSAKEGVLETVALKETSGEVSVGSVISENDIIIPTITFKELNDYVVYQLSLNYDKGLYAIDKITDDNENEFIKTTYSIINDKVFMMIQYENAVEGEFELNSVQIQVILKKIEKDHSFINPETGIKTIFPILLILLISAGTIRMIKKKNVFILLFLLIPVLVYAKEDTILEIGLSTENIKIAYTVEFFSGDGVTGSIEDIECIYGEECTLPVNTLEKEDNTFKGWSLEPGGEILYLDEAQVLDLISSGKVTLYPVWARLYTIEFNGNGSTSGSMTNLICEEGKECILSENEFEKTDYTFAGWATTSNGDIVYTDQETITNLEDNLILYAIWVVTITNFDYTGAAQTFTIPADGRYKLEVWGAQGGGTKTLGGNNTNPKYGGKGGYSKGTVELMAKTLLYVYVGGQGKEDNRSNSGVTQITTGGFNGGGNTVTQGAAGSGGGGTDIRIERDSLYARVIVAGGGGGAGWESNGFAGGGVYGICYAGTNTTSAKEKFSGAGGPTGGGTRAISGYGNYDTITSGTFGLGGIGVGNSSGSGGGGGGWYGGGGSGYSGGSGGGSGYIYTESTASNYPSGCFLNSSYYLTDADTVAGNNSFMSPTGTSETGHSGHGYARITYLGN